MVRPHRGPQSARLQPACMCDTRCSLLHPVRACRLHMCCPQCAAPGNTLCGFTFSTLARLGPCQGAEGALVLWLGFAHGPGIARRLQQLLPLSQRHRYWDALVPEPYF